MSTPRDVDQHFTVYEKFVQQAENYLVEGNNHAAAVYAEIAAAYATHHHAGLFVSYKLENILLHIGRKIANESYTPKNNARFPTNQRHVLHVLTEAMVIGGLARMVWRWIQLDSESCHSVVLTRQHQIIPQALKDAVTASGGKIYRLNDRLGNILTWSKDLRKIAVNFDFVILHIYTWDVIPLIAFADKRSTPPIILLNQSDHKFWVGVGISDVVADQRFSGFRLNQLRRGIDGSKCGLLPITVPTITREISVADAKAQIGLSEDTLLLLSIARHSKYVPLIGYGAQFNDLVLPDSVLPVLERYPKSTLIVIGPDFTERWERASLNVQGRIAALGMREDTAIYYQAADIFLDSFPFGSNTSCLEAGSYGLPVVSSNPYSADSAVLCADTPALDKSLLRVKDKSELIAVVSDLIEDAEYRTQIGKELQESILSVHTGENWKRYLYDLYQQAANAPVTTTIIDKKDQKIVSEVDILSLDIDILKDGEHVVTQDRMRFLPIDLRVKLWFQMLKEHHVFRPSLLLSEWVAVQLINMRSSVQSLHKKSI